MIDIHTDHSVMSDGSLRYYKSPCTEQLYKVQGVVEDLMHRGKYSSNLCFIRGIHK